MKGQERWIGVRSARPLRCRDEPSRTSRAVSLGGGGRACKEHSSLPLPQAWETLSTPTPSWKDSLCTIINLHLGPKKHSSWKTFFQSAATLFHTFVFICV